MSEAASPKQPTPPIHKRLLYATAVGALQNVLTPGHAAYHGLKALLSPSEFAPTLTKTYPARPRLPVRIYFPTSYDRASPRPLPLLFVIHGGGFMLGDQSQTEEFSARFSAMHTALVVSLNYAKAPANPFPGQHADLEAQIAAVCEDGELKPHIDEAKVAITGFSAGGNLAMGVCETPAVRARITAGLMPIYPVLDFGLDVEDKLKTRRYKPVLGGKRGSAKDMLSGMGLVFNWAYIPAGQDLRDPLLSPFYANRSDFPKRMWIMGCECDMLGHEAWRAACKFAGRPVPGLDEPIGQEEPADGGKQGTLILQGNEKFHFEVKDGNGTVRWTCVPDAAHGFEILELMGADVEEAKDGKLKMEGLMKEMGPWLFGK